MVASVACLLYTALVEVLDRGSGRGCLRPCGMTMQGVAAEAAVVVLAAHATFPP